MHARVDGKREEVANREDARIKGVGLMPFSRGDKLTLVLDTDAGVLRFGHNGDTHT